jgi:hypothetical protein
MVKTLNVKRLTFNVGGRMKKILLLTLMLLLAFGIVSNVSAQDAPYLFHVEREEVHVFWNPDGTTSLDYTWVFTNDPSGHVIDFVDVGMPNGNYSTMAPVPTMAPLPNTTPVTQLMGSVTGAFADVNGNRVSISSDYQGQGSYGFSIDMGAYAIQPGQTATVHVYAGGIKGMLYPDDKDEKYTSATFAPTWFGSQYVKGTTDLTVTYHLPPNMSENEPRWHAAPNGFPSEPASVYDSENRVTYTWHSPNASASEYYLFGASFPRSYVPADAIYTPPPTPLIDSDTLSGLCCGGFFVFMFIGMPAISAIQANKRKMKYLPPKVSIEGHGIKRGLTAVESAILMEQPLDKVMTMTLFGVIKKNAVSVKSRDPLVLDVVEPLPEGLNDYELNFLKAFKITDVKARQKELQDTMVALVKSVSEKMRGFSLRETTDYYKAIMEKAWQQVESANTPEVKSQKFEEALEWTMLDKDYDDRTRRTFSGPIYAPMWWGRYDPTYRPTPSASSGGGVFTPSGSSGGSKQGLPGADFAASMVTGVQTFSQKVIGNVNTFTEKVTGVTNPPPKVSSSGSRGGGGGRSCACACACAGCACACAGGGR